MAMACEKAAVAGIKSVVVFEDDDRFLDGIHRGPAFFEYAPACAHGFPNAGFVRRDHVIGHRPGAAMHDESRFIHAGRRGNS
jgi:hypothetical protein